MDDRTNDDRGREGGADEREDLSKMPKRDPHRTKAGQEASSDRVPAEHDAEHQSNYGGGGANGGTNT